MVTRLAQLRTHCSEVAECRDCPGMGRPPVIHPPILSSVYLIGQAPGIHEPPIGKPFAWTAGKTLFAWLAGIGLDEDEVRRSVFMAAVCRCFPGKTEAGSDRVPDPDEIQRCSRFLAREVTILQPELVIPVGRLAIAQILPDARQLADVVGAQHRARFHGRMVDVIPLPHPSGASTWFRSKIGKPLLKRALAKIAAHPAWDQLVCRELSA